MRPGRLLLGGSFNPVHFGHICLAHRALARLPGLVDGVDFIPCARPPHKDDRNFLPFGLRCAMLEAAMAGLPGARLNRLEAGRSGPSYTWDTVEQLKRLHPGRENFFLLGSEDFRQVPQWRNGLRLPEMCSFAVAPRGGFGEGDFDTACREMWPGGAVRRDVGGIRAFDLPGGGRALFLPLRWLDISSTQIRARWLAGARLDGLLPEPALGIMRKNREAIAACWQENGENAQGAPQGNA